MENEAKARAMTREAMERQMKAAKALLIEKLGSTSGTGEHYAHLPNRSSAQAHEKEYPTRQTGDLQKGVNYEMTPTGATLYIEDDFDKLRVLEFAPPKEGGRMFFTMFITDEETHRTMREA